MRDRRKATGSYYTPPGIARSLVKWAVRDPGDRLLDPSCGDGRFLALHQPSVGVEQDAEAAAGAGRRAPWAAVHRADFFSWSSSTAERFDCAAGNPPFIRYQRFSGETRQVALALCRRLGAPFSALTSSWAPFIVAAAHLVRPGGRIAFVVPAEIGHAPYATPLLTWLLDHFGSVQVIAVRRKLFPRLSEDCWLLHATGRGAATDRVKLTKLDAFTESSEPPPEGESIHRDDLARWTGRLRPFLVPPAARDLYLATARAAETNRLGRVARVGIGYVTGDNDFFHLRPSRARAAGIPDQFLKPTVRSGRTLRGEAITAEHVRAWLRRDDPALLLHLPRHGGTLPTEVIRYLTSPAAERARAGYKCRMRDPWYAVPDVHSPDAFLSYMSGQGPALVANRAGCVCTNTVHAVSLNGAMTFDELRRRWDHPLTRLSCELEGHPLGGGMLKLEPREAARILLPAPEPLDPEHERTVHDSLDVLRRWRHYG